MLGFHPQSSSLSDQSSLPDSEKKHVDTFVGDVGKPGNAGREFPFDTIKIINFAIRSCGHRINYDHNFCQCDPESLVRHYLPVL